MLAVKIFQGDPDALNSAVIALVEKEQSQCGLEVALYQGTELPSDQVNRIAALQPDHKILHTFHRQIGLTELEQEEPVALERVRTEAEVARALNISRAVVHSITFADHRTELPSPQKAAHQWLKGVERMQSLGLHPYLENTTEPLHWLEDLFDEWDQLGVQSQVGFTLDIGHVRVWSDQLLNQWLAFTQQLKERGFDLHFHIHANHGSRDEHISLIRAFQDDLLEPSEDWAPLGVIPWLKAAMQAHSNALFTLENPSHEAQDNWEFTRFMLNAES